MGKKGHIEVGGKSLNKFISYDIKGFNENLKLCNEKIKDLYGNGHKVLYDQIIGNIYKKKLLLPMSLFII